MVASISLLEVSKPNCGKSSGKIKSRLWPYDYGNYWRQLCSALILDDGMMLNRRRWLLTSCLELPAQGILLLIGLPLPQSRTSYAHQSTTIHKCFVCLVSCTTILVSKLSLASIKRLWSCYVILLGALKIVYCYDHNHVEKYQSQTFDKAMFALAR